MHGIESYSELRLTLDCTPFERETEAKAKAKAESMTITDTLEEERSQRRALRKSRRDAIKSSNFVRAA